MNDNTLLIGDCIGNIYEFSINFYDPNILNMKEVFNAHKDEVDYLLKYQGNKIISASRLNIKIWDLSSMENDCLQFIHY